MISPAPHNDTTLVLRRTFTASRERVFRAWTTPRALERWLRPRGKSMAVRSLDARVGGSFRFELEDGSSIIGTLQIIGLSSCLDFLLTNLITHLIIRISKDQAVDGKPETTWLKSRTKFLIAIRQNFWGGY